jgi:hypothetical protein
LVIVVGNGEAGRGWRLDAHMPIGHAIAVSLRLPANCDAITNIEVILAVAFVDHFEAFCQCPIPVFLHSIFRLYRLVASVVAADGRQQGRQSEGRQRDDEADGAHHCTGNEMMSVRASMSTNA